MKDDKTFNKWFNTFILVGMAVVTVVVTAIKFQGTESGRAMLVISAVGSLMGVLSTVCAANGRILTFLFGFIDVTIYGVMCLIGTRYGNAALHLLYFLPMQFVGYFQWRKRGAQEQKKVQARRLDGKQWLLFGSIFLIGLVAAYFILSALDKTEAAGVVKWLVVMDAFSMMCNIIGQYLLSTAYMDQWIFWIGVNVSTIIMWVLTLRQEPGSSYALIYVVKYSFYLLNSLNGLRIWLNLSRPETP
ncbi:MAG: nicotinamide mononucleotide transporter [Bacteroidales bacterium]|jgi:nicotinamide mononucleotide transporter|nr:nicotinamide mononucleotide transporter [Bacteroidales bacterium]